MKPLLSKNLLKFKNNLLALPCNGQAASYSLNSREESFSFLKEFKKLLERWCEENQARQAAKDLQPEKNNKGTGSKAFKVLSGKPREGHRSPDTTTEHRINELNRENLELKNSLENLRQSQRQDIVQEKMATLGQVMASITHELNSPLGAIRSVNATKLKALQNLKSALQNYSHENSSHDRRMQKNVDVLLQAEKVIDQGASRLAETLSNLKYFSRTNHSEFQTTDIHKGLEGALALLVQDDYQKIEWVRDYGKIPPIVCHPQKLNQVFLNLLMNAGQSIKGRGRVTLTTGIKEGQVCVAIKDTGRGIKPQQLKSVFDPGFTSKNSVIRASFDLSICYQIVQEHLGDIKVESRENEGSVFTVMLPVGT